MKSSNSINSFISKGGGGVGAGESPHLEIIELIELIEVIESIELIQLIQ